MPDNSSLFVAMHFNSALPIEFPSPFDVTPHTTARQAAESLQSQLRERYAAIHAFDDPDGGKMFGVLVVKDASGQTGYLSAYSGMLGNRWQNDGFVPPVFNELEREQLLGSGEDAVAALTQQIESLEIDPEYLSAKSAVEYYNSAADHQINAMKVLHTEKKQKRHALRQCQTTDENTLQALGNESRQDKYALKTLKTKLQSNGEGVFKELQEYQVQLDILKKQRRKMSAKLQADLFGGYRLVSVDGQQRQIGDFFEGALPPSGAGDCAATKLIHYANVSNLHPLALAEFWWGAAPSAALRTHGRYYPSCRSRCRVVLPFMLSGVSVTIPLHEQPADVNDEYPLTLHEDDDIVVVEKPAGLLSVPGKVLNDSVEARLKSRYPEVAGVMLLHRLDQATSGVMIAAKNPAAYKNLQHQFQDRTVKKKYIAVLDGVLKEDEGEIVLPLRIDIYDRPRQIVCYERGKQALTRYSVIERTENTTKVEFKPHTGRTHQLRVHAAHPEGLNCPIVGDELYGRSAKRLYLHAAELTITHPVKDIRMTFSATGSATGDF